MVSVSKELLLSKGFEFIEEAEYEEGYGNHYVYRTKNEEEIKNMLGEDYRENDSDLIIEISEDFKEIEEIINGEPIDLSDDELSEILNRIQ